LEDGAAKSGSDQRAVTQRDVNLHDVVEETRRGDRRHIERPRLGDAVEVPGEFATVRNEADDFAVFHVDPLRPAADVDGAPGKGRYDRALGRGRLRRLARRSARIVAAPADRLAAESVTAKRLEMASFMWFLLSMVGLR